MVVLAYPTDDQVEGVVVEKSPVDILRIFKVSGQLVTDYLLKKADSGEEVSWAEIKELLKKHFTDFGDYMVALDFAFNLIKDWRSVL